MKEHVKYTKIKATSALMKSKLLLRFVVAVKVRPACFRRKTCAKMPDLGFKANISKLAVHEKVCAYQP